jgi:hypothetical protein
MHTVKELLEQLRKKTPNSQQLYRYTDSQHQAVLSLLSQSEQEEDRLIKRCNELSEQLEAERKKYRDYQNHVRTKYEGF